MTNQIKKYAKHLLLIAVILLSASCSDWDDFKKYTTDGEIIYPGKVDWVEIYSGENRVLIEGMLGPDPIVTKYRVYWNDYEDSVEFTVIDENRLTIFSHILEVGEGVRTFIFHTYDDAGNVSIASSEIGASYGDSYRKKMTNRVVSSTLSTDTSTLIIWEPIDVTTGAQSTEIEYTAEGATTTVEAAVTSDTVNLIGLLASGSISFRTAYKPELTCIDTFYTETTTYDVVR